ncbi:hypothetical protein B9Z19DRAFT_1086980 [Tuber borchii]|uniref:Uncharacterized protein n=1 Tax=Tuber borchii TaxID=42251 RepID=A0A2T6ZNM0_TUBBO|nr:hypothetical protein B9Z19DRAFT_1086980 [Tuber borchii]
MKDKRIAEVASAPPVDEKEYATPVSFQVKEVMKRTNLSFWRTRITGLPGCSIMLRSSLDLGSYN